MATEVSYHRDGYGPARPAVNVKVYGFAGLEHGALYATLGENRADELYRQAEEAVYARFWADAADKAEALGLGPIEQEGRSGGWLVLTDGYDPQTDEDYEQDGVSAPTRRREWLAAYRQLAEWCDEQVATAPARVAALAQQLAMDELGAEPARRMFATFQRVNDQCLGTIEWWARVPAEEN